MTRRRRDPEVCSIRKFERSEGMAELEGHRILALPQSPGYELEVASSSASISENSDSTSSTDMIEVEERADEVLIRMMHCQPIWLIEVEEMMASQHRPLLSL